MKAPLQTTDCWDIMVIGYKKPENKEALTKAQKDLESLERKIVKSFILSTVESKRAFETIFELTTSKQVWKILQNSFKRVEKVKKVQLKHSKRIFKI